MNERSNAGASSDRRAPSGKTSYDVRVWTIRAYEGARRRTYTVRWTVAGREFRDTFATRALAESFRADLLSAARKGEAFDSGAGLPVSMQADVGEAQRSWYVTSQVVAA